MFWTLPFGKLFVCFFDGLRSGQKDDEEVFSETCQSSSEEGKGQDTTSQKWKKLLLRSWNSFRKKKHVLRSRKKQRVKIFGFGDLNFLVTGLHGCGSE